MAIEFREMTEEEIAAAEVSGKLWAAEHAEHQRLVRACVEAHGVHAWELYLYDPEDDAFVALYCEHCPADTNDLYPDGTDMLYAEFDDVIVDAGRHNSPVGLIVPVEAEIWSLKHWTDYGWDYDAGVEIWARGPVRPLAPPGGDDDA
jgi:hypothetical protein